jgi:hypothetical protein
MTFIPPTPQNLGGAGVTSSRGPTRSSQILNCIIAANSTLPIAQAGNRFYIIACSFPVRIRPQNGTFNTYYQGTGLSVDPDNSFSSIEVQNNTSNSIVVSLFVGFGDYIDNRAILVNDVIQQVINPTYFVPNALNTVSIPDLSGQPFVDINGNPWLALNRISLQISNLDATNNLQIRDYARAVGSIGIVFSETSYIIGTAGDYALQIGGGSTPINAIVSEVYNAIAPSIS